MRKKIKYIFLISILLGIGFYTKSYAKITTNDPKVNAGDEVTITINSQEPVASGAIKITSNGGLTYNSVSGGVKNGNLVAFSQANNMTKGIVTYKFTAPKTAEDKTYKVVFSSQDMADENGTPIASTSATATVTVKGTGSGTTTPTKVEPKITKLVVAGKTYNNPKTSLAVDVKNDVTTAKIAVTTNTGSYKIDKGTSVKLEEGSNTVKITLDSGKVYTVNIRRAAKVEDQPNVQDEDVTPLLKSLSIKGVKAESKEKVDIPYTPEFSSEVYEYKVALGEEFADVTKLDIKAVGANEDFKVEITGNEELKDGENVITITVKTKNDSKVTTYKIIVTKGVETEVIETVTEPEDEYQLPEPEQIKPFWNGTQSMIVIIVTSIVAILGIVFAVVEYNYTKKHKSEEPHIPYAGINTESEDSGMSEKANKKKEKAAKKELKKDEDKKGKHF